MGGFYLRQQLPDKLRLHKFSESLPEEKTLPAPGYEFQEIEAAKKHGGWGEWLKLSVMDRGRLLAHELHAKMREHYEYDMRGDGGGASRGKDKKAPWSQMRERFFADK